MSFNEWKEVTLEEVIDILGDGLHGTPKYNENGEYYFINGNNLDGKIVINNNTKKVGIEEYLKYKKDLNERTLFVSINGTLGKVAEYGGEKIVLGKSACYFNVKPDVSKTYIKYILLSCRFKHYIHTHSTGTTIKNMGLKQMREFKFPLPNIEEQNAIAKILSDLDNKIEVNNKINKRLEDMAQSIFKHWFVDFEFPNEEGNPYKSSGGEMVESELGMVPKGWEVKKVNDIVDVTDYVANGSFSSLKNNVKQGEDEDYAVLIRLVDYNRNFKGSFMYVDKFGYEFLKKSKLFGGEIIISNVGANAGTVFKAPKLNKPMTLGPNSIMIIKNNFNNYIYYYLLGTNGQKSLKGIIGGSAQPKFNKTDFRNIKLLLPKSMYIDKFNSIINPIQDKIEIIKKQNRKLEDARDTLLSKLMSGEIIVPIDK